MSRTNIHKIEGKFRNGLVQLSNIPYNILNSWNRHNWWKGKFKRLKLDKLEKILEKEFRNERP